MDEQSVVNESLIRETPAMRLGQRLRRARLARNLTQGEVAKNLFSVSYVSAVERGQIRPSLGALEKLAERLQVQVPELLGTGQFEPQAIATGQEAISERYREEYESRLREARKLTRQGTPQTISQALDILLRLSGQQLSQRDHARADLLLAQCFIKQGRGEDARRAAQAGLGVAERLGDRELAERLRFELGNAAMLLQSPTLALEYYRRNVDAIERNDVPDLTLQMAIYSALGHALAQRGDTEGAIQYLQLATQRADEIASPERLGQVYWDIAQAQAARGDLSEARQFAQKSIAAYEEAELRRLMATVYERLGGTYADAGQFQQAVDQLQQAIALAAAQHDARGHAEALRSLSAVYLREQKYAEAADAAQNAAQLSSSSNDAYGEAQALLALAHVHSEQKQESDAEHDYTRAIELLRASGDNEALSEALTEYSKYLDARGQQQKAYDILKQAVDLSQRLTGAVR
jgi:tetratricopeptide (TPR) repeat protein